MKYKLVALLLVAVLILGFSAPAYAGIFGSAKDWVLNNALSSIIALVFLIISGFWGATKWGKIALRGRLPMQEALDVYHSVRAARRANSPGGKTITPDENAEIFKQVEEFTVSLIKAVTGKTPV
ncbi:MAG: hypothetical protein NWE89_11785 [Candidatus Bathyarchaeota archaeon]|nr:hypothetical protein [Candidatus Bathyarchaeota archaeon]